MGGRRAEIEAVSGIDDQSAQFSRHDTELGLYWLVGCLEDSHPRPALWRDRILTPPSSSRAPPHRRQLARL